MSGLSPVGKQVMLEAFTADAAYTSLHSALPDDSGSDEISGGLPAYTRQPVEWGAFDTVDSIPSAVDLEWDIPPGTDITHLGYWTAPNGGVFLGWRPLSDPESFTGQGFHTIPSGSLVETLS